MPKYGNQHCEGARLVAVFETFTETKSDLKGPSWFPCDLLLTAVISKFADSHQ